MRGRCSHLQSFHSSRYVFLRQRVTCHTSWCRLKNEDTVMGQGFVSHASFGAGKEGRVVSALGTALQHFPALLHQGRGIIKSPGSDASHLTSDFCMLAV